MSSRVAFENNFDDYTKTASTNILNDNNDGLSEIFQSKLQKFKTNKLHELNSKLHEKIFHDNTIYTGCTGIALYYFNLFLKNEDLLLLEKALDYIDLGSLKGRRISFLCGDAGPLAIATVISYKFRNQQLKNLPDYKTLLQRLISLISLLDESPDELLYGKSGYLYALLFVNKYVNGKELIPAKHIEKVIDSILKSGKQFSLQMKSESPLLWQWHDKIYFGAAHGMAGILYMLLQARNYMSVIEIRSYIKPTLDWLMNQRYTSGNFPSSLTSSTNDRLVQWCHGAPGFTPLCILASKVFDDDKYMKIALQCGEVVWERGLCTKGYSMCHGVAGNAYTFIQLYQATKKPIYLYRACCFTEWCAVERPGSELRRPDRPASLFEGLTGRLYLIEDMNHITDARFPALCL